MHKFTSMYAHVTIVAADGDESTTRADQGRDDALADILEADTSSLRQFASTADLTAAFYRHIRAVAEPDPMDQEEEDAHIDDDEY